MIFHLEIPDEDYEYLVSKFAKHFHTPDRRNTPESVNNLIRMGLIKQDSYYGESMCYNPTYSLTELGKLVRDRSKS